LTLPRNVGRYEIIEEIGRGSMGVVYRARDPRIGRIVALKCVAFSFPLAPGEEQEFLGRFYHEAQIAGRLSHPNIVTIHDVGTLDSDGHAFMAMEYVTGINLQEHLAGGGRLPFPQIAAVARQAAEALDYAHGCGVVHRDIKPGNLVLAEAGTLKILDFGIARIATANSTKPGRLLGTPNYMAPEQVTGLPVDGRADQFSLAVTLYHLLTGERPFTGESLTAISYQVVNIMPPPPSRLNQSLPASVDPVLARAMSKNAGDRYLNCTEFASDLSQTLAAWKEAADRDAPRTLVTAASGLNAGVAGSLPGAGPFAPGSQRALVGWGMVVAVLGLVAAAPYLLKGTTRPGVVAASSSAAIERPAENPPPPPSTRAGSATGAPSTPEVRGLFGFAPLPPPPPIKPAPAPVVPQGSLVIELLHRIDRGTLNLRVDDREVARERFTGRTGRNRWRRTYSVPAGNRRVEIRVHGDGLDEIEGVNVDVAEGGKSALEVSFTPLTHRLKIRPIDPAEARP